MNPDNFAKALIADCQCRTKLISEFRALHSNKKLKYRGAYTDINGLNLSYKYLANVSIYFSAFDILVSKDQTFYMNWNATHFNILKVDHEP